MRTEAFRARRVLGYVRVSSIDQEAGCSPEDQRQEIDRYSKSIGLDITDDCWYVESESATSNNVEKRDEMNRLLASIKPGDLILCNMVDRWSRDTRFALNSVHQIFKKNASIYFISEDIDCRTENGYDVLVQRSLEAEKEGRRIKKRLVGTRQRWRNNGYYTEGPAPYGYSRSAPKRKDRMAKNILQIVEKEADIVREIFKLCIDGNSITDIIDHCNVNYPFRGWDKKSVGLMLRSRVYLGEIRNTSDVWIAGKHPAIITPEVFMKAGKALESRVLGGGKLQQGSRTDNWLCRENGVCGSCGAHISAAYGGKHFVDGKRAYVDYYKCCRNRKDSRERCNSKYTLVEKVDAYVTEQVKIRIWSLAEMLAIPTKAVERPKVDHSVEKQKLKDAKVRYLTLFGKGLFSEEELAEEINSANAKIEALEAAERASEKPVADRPEVRRELLGSLKYLKLAWTLMPMQKRRQALKLLTRCVRIGGEVPAEIVWRSVEEMLES